jgi:hypothetical protein
MITSVLRLAVTRELRALVVKRATEAPEEL